MLSLARPLLPLLCLLLLSITAAAQASGTISGTTGSTGSTPLDLRTGDAFTLDLNMSNNTVQLTNSANGQTRTFGHIGSLGGILIFRMWTFDAIHGWRQYTILIWPGAFDSGGGPIYVEVQRSDGTIGSASGTSSVP